jgi:hypothetical protein
MTFNRDYNFGKQQEMSIFPTLCNFFKDDEIVPSTQRYKKHDFEGKTYLYELKSRTCKFNSFTTTLLPADKVIKTRKQIFIFNFTDGLYYIEYDDEAWKDIEIASFRRFRIGVNDKEKPYYHIPITLLKKIG